MLQDVYIASTAQKMSASTICGPRTAKIEEPFFIPFQLLTFEEQHNRIHLARPYPDLMDLNYVPLYSSRLAQVFNKYDPKVARELAYMFPLLGICNKLKDSNCDCKFLT